MRPTVIEYCVDCGKEVEHLPYYEEDYFLYNEVEVPYQDRGLICCNCGCQSNSPEQWDTIMKEIKETYEQMRYR